MRIALEPNNDSGLVSEIALILIACRKSVAETCKHEIKLCWSNRDRSRQRDIDASTNDEIERVVARVICRCASSLASLLKILICVGVSPSE